MFYKHYCCEFNLVLCDCNVQVIFKRIHLRKLDVDGYTCTLVALGKLRQEDQKFQGNLDYTVNLRPAKTSRDKGQLIHSQRPNNHNKSILL